MNKNPLAIEMSSMKQPTNKSMPTINAKFCIGGQEDEELTLQIQKDENGEIFIDPMSVTDGFIDKIKTLIDSHKKTLSESNKTMEFTSIHPSMIDNLYFVAFPTPKKVQDARLNNEPYIDNLKSRTLYLKEELDKKWSDSDFVSKAESFVDSQRFISGDFSAKMDVTWLKKIDAVKPLITKYLNEDKSKKTDAVPIILIHYKEAIEFIKENCYDVFENFIVTTVAVLPKDKRLPLCSVKNLKNFFGYSRESAEAIYNWVSNAPNMPSKKRGINAYLLDPNDEPPFEFEVSVGRGDDYMNTVTWTDKKRIDQESINNGMRLSHKATSEIVDSIDESKLIKLPLALWKEIAQTIYSDENLTPWAELSTKTQQRFIVNTIRHNGIAGYQQTWCHDDKDKRVETHDLVFEKIQRIIANNYPFLRNAALHQLDEREERTLNQMKPNQTE